MSLKQVVTKDYKNGAMQTLLVRVQQSLDSGHYC
jgi:hypothetical protein